MSHRKRSKTVEWSASDERPLCRGCKWFVKARARDFRFASFTTIYQPAGVGTPVTFTASFNGSSVSTTATIPKTVDTVAVTRAEFTVKTGQLRVDATGNTPGAALTLYNAATGQVIGTMADNGPGGGGEKYSFQGPANAIVRQHAGANRGNSHPQICNFFAVEGPAAPYVAEFTEPPIGTRRAQTHYCHLQLRRISA